MSNTDFDSPDEWQELADECCADLRAHGIACSLHDEGMADSLNQGDWPMLLEYAKFIPVYSIALSGAADTELAIVAAKLPQRRLNVLLPAEPFNARYFNEVNDEFMIGLEHARYIGLVKMANDPGNIHIEPRTTGTGLADLFAGQSLNIDGFKEFTRSYHFECNDVALAEDVLTSDFFELISGLGEVWIDIQDGLLLVIYKATTEPAQAIGLANFIKEFATPSKTKA